MLGRDQSGQAGLRRAGAGADTGAVADDQQALLRFCRRDLQRLAAAGQRGRLREPEGGVERGDDERRGDDAGEQRVLRGEAMAQSRCRGIAIGSSNPGKRCRTTIRQPLLCFAISARAVSSSFLPSKLRLFISATHSSSIACDTLMNSFASVSLSV